MGVTRTASLTMLALLAACRRDAPGADPQRNHAAAVSDEVVVPEPPAEVNLAGPAAPAVQLAPDGLTITPAGGEAHQLSFGLPREAVTADLGAPQQQGIASDCGVGPLGYARYPGGLSLSFQDDSFAGWTLDRGTLVTAEGIGIGSTRQQIEATGPVTVMDQSTIGIEFVASDFSGLLDSRGPAARITQLWAGITCITR